MVAQQMINNQFWVGKKVFLTGHSGFKGAWLSHWLDHLGARTVGFSKYTSPQQKDLADRVDLFLGHFEEEWVQDRLVIAKYGLFEDFAFLRR